MEKRAWLGRRERHNSALYKYTRLEKRRARLWGRPATLRHRNLRSLHDGFPPPLHALRSFTSRGCCFQDINLGVYLGRALISEGRGGVSSRHQLGASTPPSPPEPVFWLGDQGASAKGLLQSQQAVSWAGERAS